MAKSSGRVVVKNSMPKRLRSWANGRFRAHAAAKEIGDRYPGTCRQGVPEGRQARAIRMRVESEAIAFHDRRLGTFEETLTQTCGDFVLRRADGYFSYQLAVVVDDGAQGITDIVRGADLLDSTARQVWLQSKLNLPPAKYLHLPVVMNAAGEKLSKQTHAPAIDPHGSEETLTAALRILGIHPPQLLAGAGCEPLLAWAITAWPDAGF
jgi:glutamyl-Q tRNA(Asp) synthetase